MKKQLLLSALLMLAASVAQATTTYTTSWSSGFANGGIIPDGNPTGWSDTRTLSISMPRPSDTTIIGNVSVTLNISGGYNGDLYGYLVHSSGYAVLLNRSGTTSGNPFGFGDSGYSITLDDSGSDIHLATSGGGPLSGLFAPDGRNVNPATVTDASGRTAFLSSFNGTDANGTWTLFLADMSGGDLSTITSWGLNLTLIPEPTTWAMVVFGLVGAGWQLRRYLARRQAVTR